MYEMIDRRCVFRIYIQLSTDHGGSRAKGDISVQRDKAYHSRASLSDIADDAQAPTPKRLKKEHSASSVATAHNDPFDQVIAVMNTRAKVEAEHLEIAKQDKLDRDKFRQAELEQNKRELRLKERAQALEMVKHSDPEIVEEGRRILRRLRAEEDAA